MQEFIIRSVNEINQIASDRHHHQLFQKRSPQVNSGLNEHKEISEINKKRIKTPKLRNRDTKFEVEDNLDEQVMMRIQGAKDVAALLEAIEAQKAEQRRAYLAESKEIERKLANINKRLNIAQNNSDCRLQQRVLTATQSVKLSEIAHEKINLDFKKREQDRKEQYAIKAEKIKNSKLMRERILKESVARKEEEYIRRKQTQLANFKKLREELSTLKERKTTSKEKKTEPEYKFFQVSYECKVD